MKDILSKKVHPLIVYPILVIFSFSVVLTPLFFYIKTPAFAQSFLQPFTGTITQVDYVSCFCGLSILLTIQPNEASPEGQQEQMLFFYAAQLVEDLFGIDIMPGDLPPPTVFPFYMIWSAGSQTLLGNYMPIPVPCVEYIPPYSCAINGYYVPILFVGTNIS